MITLELKRGDSLVLDCVVQSEGQPVDIAGWQIASQINAPGGQCVHKFAVEIIDPAGGAYRLPASPDQTRGWPLGPLSMDIRYTDAAAGVMSTNTVQLRVAPRETP